MNGIIKLLDKTSLTGSFFQQLINQLNKLQTETTKKYRMGPGDGTNDTTEWIDEIVRIREKLEILRTACNLSIDPHAGLKDLAELGTAFGYDLKVDLVLKEAELPKGTRLDPHPHGKLADNAIEKPKKVLCVGDLVVKTDFPQGELLLITCLAPLVLLKRPSTVWETSVPFDLFKVVGHVTPEELSIARKLLTLEQYSSSVSLTRIEV